MICEHTLAAQFNHTTKSSSQEFSILIQAFERIANIWTTRSDTSVFKSETLNTIVAAFPPLHDVVVAVKVDYNLKQGREGNLDAIWNDLAKYPAIIQAKQSIKGVQDKLVEELKKGVLA